MKSLRKRIARISSSIILPLQFLLASCAGTPPTESPIPSISSVVRDSPGKTLVVMLPGLGDRADNFLKSDFVGIGNRQRFDVIAVDAHFGYYNERNLIPRLHDDIILPARKRGYENIWLLGVSMGGFGSLLYTATHPDMVTGVILLAPYLGSLELVDEIENAGGLAAWNGDAKAFKQYEVDLWRWLKSETADSNGTSVVLGFGRSDRLATAYGPLLQALDSSNVFESDGGHNWKTWGPLWSRIAAECEIAPAM